MSVGTASGHWVVRVLWTLVAAALAVTVAASGRAASSAATREFSTAMSADAGPFGITAGPDGNLWFTEIAATGSGASPPPALSPSSRPASAQSGPAEITAGPDGNLWFTECKGNRIGRITPDGRRDRVLGGHPPEELPRRDRRRPRRQPLVCGGRRQPHRADHPDRPVTEFSAGIRPRALP